MLGIAVGVDVAFGVCGFGAACGLVGLRDLVGGVRFAVLVRLACVSWCGWGCCSFCWVLCGLGMGRFGLACLRLVGSVWVWCGLALVLLLLLVG